MTTQPGLTRWAGVLLVLLALSVPACFGNNSKSNEGQQPWGFLTTRDDGSAVIGGFVFPEKGARITLDDVLAFQNVRGNWAGTEEDARRLLKTLDQAEDCAASWVRCTDKRTGERVPEQEARMVESFLSHSDKSRSDLREATITAGRVRAQWDMEDDDSLVMMGGIDEDAMALLAGQVALSKTADGQLRTGEARVIYLANFESGQSAAHVSTDFRVPSLGFEVNCDLQMTCSPKP